MLFLDLLLQMYYLYFCSSIIIIPGAEILKNITVCKFHVPGFAAVN